MAEALALGAALHYDFDLAADPRPFEAIAGAVFGSESNDTPLIGWVIDVKNYAPPPSPLDLPALLRQIRKGSVSTAAVETAADTPDDERMLVSAGSTPAADRPERFVLTRCRYDFKAYFGATRLRVLGAQRTLDAVIAFADAVAVRAGVVHWAELTSYAASLASGGTSERLSREQNDHLSDLAYWRPRWGDVIRGPAWGTFLGAAHVQALGGIARIERESGCARVVALSSNGAFLQLTSVDAPIPEGHDDDGALVRLAAFLAPVMGKR